jgi:hypothetical protein
MPDLCSEVDLWIDDRLVARSRADAFRSDLAAAFD